MFWNLKVAIALVIGVAAIFAYIIYLNSRIESLAASNELLAAQNHSLASTLKNYAEASEAARIDSEALANRLAISRRENEARREASRNLAETLKNNPNAIDAINHDYAAQQRCIELLSGDTLNEDTNDQCPSVVRSLRQTTNRRPR